jgi:hypothetical protein
MARQYQNLETQHLKDRSSSKSKSPFGKSAGSSFGKIDKPGADEEAFADHEENEGQDENPEEVVAEHGKANELKIVHDEEKGEHHVHSTHPDGHSTHSKHGSAQEAHQHAASLAGVSAGEGEGDEAEASPISGGGESSIPTMGV